MRILLLSDTHNDTNRIDMVLEQCGKIDQIIHCGDVERDCEYISYMVPPLTPIVSVSGNNEWYAEKPYFTALPFEGIRFYITHGHQERVKRDFSGLIYQAKKNDCSVVLFGHTHKRTDEIQDGIRLINPGSVCYPTCSYAILTVANGTVKTEFFDL
ncbi:MAG: metallophosphoesterase [Clostridia bacterium]|nr:metallophosphoesterase [Clostridia bacterium]